MILHHVLNKKSINTCKNYKYNTQREHKTQRLMKQAEIVTQRCNTDKKNFFLARVIWVGVEDAKSWLASQAPLQCSIWKLPSGWKSKQAHLIFFLNDGFMLGCSHSEIRHGAKPPLRRYTKIEVAP